MTWMCYSVTVDWGADGRVIANNHGMCGLFGMGVTHVGRLRECRETANNSVEHAISY